MRSTDKCDPENGYTCGGLTVWLEMQDERYPNSRASLDLRCWRNFNTGEDMGLKLVIEIGTKLFTVLPFCPFCGVDIEGCFKGSLNSFRDEEV